MLKKGLHSACFVVLGVVSSSVLAESAIDLSVVGTITPSACRVDLAGGGVVDYGVLHPSLLEADDYTLLPAQRLSFSVLCDAPARVGLTAVDGRQGTVVSDTIYPHGPGRTPLELDLPTRYVVGLGLDGADKVGGYALVVGADSLLADGVSVEPIARNSDYDDGVFISANGLYNAISRTVSWALPGELTPVGAASVTGYIEVQAYLNKGSELDLSKPVALDGLTTLELVYL